MITVSLLRLQMLRMPTAILLLRRPCQRLLKLRSPVRAWESRDSFRCSTSRPSNPPQAVPLRRFLHRAPPNPASGRRPLHHSISRAIPWRPRHLRLPLPPHIHRSRPHPPRFRSLRPLRPPGPANTLGSSMRRGSVSYPCKAGRLRKASRPSRLRTSLLRPNSLRRKCPAIPCRPLLLRRLCRASEPCRNPARSHLHLNHRLSPCSSVLRRLHPCPCLAACRSPECMLLRPCHRFLNSRRSKRRNHRQASCSNSSLSFWSSSSFCF